MLWGSVLTVQRSSPWGVLASHSRKEEFPSTPYRTWVSTASHSDHNDNNNNINNINNNINNNNNSVDTLTTQRWVPRPRPLLPIKV